MVAGVLGALAGPTLADGKHAFTLIPMRPGDEEAASSGYPSDSTWTLVDVIRINNNGDILAIFNDGTDDYAWRRTAPASGDRWNEGTWTKITNGNNDPTFGWDFNDSGSVVGDFVDSTQGDAVRGMEWIPPSTFFGYFDEGAVYGINNSHELCGCELDMTDWVPVSRVAGISFWEDLPELSNWEGHCAFALSDGRTNGSSVRYVHVVGMAQVDLQQTSRAVVWQFRDSNVYLEELDGGTGSLEWGPHPVAVNSKGMIAGWFWAQNGTGNRLPMVWVPESDFGMNWDDTVFTGSDNPAYDLNESGEMLTEHGIWAWNGYFGSAAAFTFVDVPDHVNYPLDSDPETLSLRSINDDGVMVGILDIDSDPTIVVIYPHDTNNNGEPDFREIVADGTLDDDATYGGDWVLDWAQEFRTGLYAVASPSTTRADEIENVQIVRIHLDQFQTVSALTSGTVDGQSFRETLNDYGYVSSTSEVSREILLMYRTVMHKDWAQDRPAGYVYNRHYDYIPTTGTPYGEELTQDEILADLECFASQIADHVEYMQFGNEVYDAIGQYYFHANDLGGGWPGGTFTEVPKNSIPVAADAMFGWLDRQAEAARKGSAMAGRPLRIVSPAILPHLVKTASESTGADDNKSSKYTYSHFLAANQYADASAVHMHFTTEAEGQRNEVNADWLTSTSTWLASAGALPEQLACTEWGPYASEAWRIAHSAQANLYYVRYNQNNVPVHCHPQNDPDEANYNVFVQDSFLGADPLIGPGTTMRAEEHLDAMVENGFLFGCFGSYIQIGRCGDPDNFDLASIFAGAIHSDWLPTAPFCETIRDLYETYAADRFIPLADFYEFGLLHPTSHPGFVSCD